MKILLISYFLPPDKSVGGFRALSFAKHLPSFGINLSILTAETVPDKAKYLKEELGIEQLYLAKASRVRELGYKTKILNILELLNLESFFFFPDLYFNWKKKAIKQGEKAIKEENIEAILVTIPPYTAAVVAYKLAKKYTLPLLLDYRDPWASHPNIKFPGKFMQKRHEKLEKRIVNYATFYSTVCRENARVIEQSSGIHTEEFKIIYNGYFDENVPKKDTPKITDKFTLSYFGNYYKGHKNSIKEFVLGFKMMVEKNNLSTDDICLRYAGTKSRSAIQRDLSIGDLEEYFVDLGVLEGDKLIAEIQKSHINYVFAPKSLQHALATKIFDYGLGNSHILLIGEKDAIFNWCIEINQKFTYAKEDRYEIAEMLEKLYKLWKDGKLEYGCDSEKIKEYNRKFQALKLAGLINDAIEV